MTFAELEKRFVAMERRLNEQDKKLERALHERDEYRKLYELTHIELERTRRHLFGQKAERVDPAQMQRRPRRRRAIDSQYGGQ